MKDIGKNINTEKSVYEALQHAASTYIGIIDEKDIIVSEARPLIDELYKQIKNRIEKGGEIESKIALTFLLTTMVRVIKNHCDTIDCEYFVESIYQHLRNELAL